ncbi:hypothetical protein GCM10009584_23740 [Ornithinimicrobium humiphilum]|uniref:Uncharacterized protein n=1 Tax=Ornithinimicrobium humiphilum TaxID=125288 RepID=A0A543KMM9_9MICO|nr:hypothetical protein [Ornithinimicrobium humiphilum]TQM96333.1 hypothetical protein FB476_1199 [Ornithinimicrobium humiphilum]
MDDLTPDDPIDDEPDPRTAGQLLCRHRFVQCAPGREEPHCPLCDLAYADYIYGEVRGALSRMDAWP